MRTPFVLMLPAVALAAAVPAVAAERVDRAIDAVMVTSVAGWNAGDVDRFMSIYSTAPTASFVTSRGLLRGRAAMIDSYRKTYDFGDAAKRGTLKIERIDFRTLGSNHALYIGRFTLTYPGGKIDSGYTSLVFAREQTGWKVIADHSSWRSGPRQDVIRLTQTAERPPVQQKPQHVRPAHTGAVE